MIYRMGEGSGQTLEMPDMDNRFFLVGLLNAFVNRLQAAGDEFFEEISWKQSFVLICLRLFDAPPTLGELSDLLGSSHQNVRQLLGKLEKAGYVTFLPDPDDRRKQRIAVTAKTEAFSQAHNAPSAAFMDRLFDSVDPQQLQTTVSTLLQLDSQLKRMRSDKK